MATECVFTKAWRTAARQRTRHSLTQVLLLSPTHRLHKITNEHVFMNVLGVSRPPEDRIVTTECVFMMAWRSAHKVVFVCRVSERKRRSEWFLSRSLQSNLLLISSYLGFLSLSLVLSLSPIGH